MMICTSCLVARTRPAQTLVVSAEKARHPRHTFGFNFTHQDSIVWSAQMTHCKELMSRQASAYCKEGV